MTGIYRVRYKRGDLEVEVESSDKAYVDKKLAELMSFTPDAIPKGKSKPPLERKPISANPSDNNGAGDESSLDIAGLVGFIKDSDKYPKVEKEVLNKKKQISRIMMVLYFANDFADDPHLSTGQIETITDQLGVRIQSANVGKAIQKDQKYFTAKAVRKQGTKVPYKLNRQGLQAFEKYLDGEKL